MEEDLFYNMYVVYFPEQTSVSLEDLNISCPVKQGEIPVSLRAVSTDEEGHHLSGPSWGMKITCPSKGSYNSDVPIIQSNTHILLVPFPVSNQHNTNLLNALAQGSLVSRIYV